MAPCNFWLFPKIKSAFGGKPFSRIQDLAKAVHSEMRAIPEMRMLPEVEDEDATMYRSRGKLLEGI